MQDRIEQGRFWRDPAQAWIGDPLVKPVEAVLQTKDDKRDVRIQKHRISNASVGGDSVFMWRRREKSRVLFGLALIGGLAFVIFAIMADR